MRRDRCALKIVARPDLKNGKRRPVLARIQRLQGLTRLKETRAPVVASRTMTEHDELKAAAVEILAMRRRRESVLSNRLIGEAAWDILLAAYSSPNAVIQTKELCASTQVPESTALRWVQVLEREGFLVKAAHPIRQDGRATYYRLTHSGRINVEHALEAMLHD